MRSSHWSRSIALVLAVGLTVSGCAATSRHSASRSEAARPTSAAPVVRVVAAGDIACAPAMETTPTQCQQAATAAAARRFDPALVLTLGDHQYNSSSLAEFQASYDRSWGALRSLTRPAIGNHEYLTPRAAGYYSYFRGRQPGPPGYYRVHAGSWQVYVLNANCGKVSCAAEARWLDRQMRQHPARCSMITMHQPRFSSGREHGNDPAVTPLWNAAYRHRNDVVLSGHDHDYERFKRMDARGRVKPARGMLSFVVGTGGSTLYHLGKRKKGSAYFQARSFGVLELLLRQRTFTWSFRTTAGKVLDSGTRTCL